MIYIAIFAFLVVLSFFEVINALKPKTQKMFTITIGLIFFLMSSLRWERGTDWNSYYTFFYGGYNPGFEIGYTTLVSIIKSVTNNYTVYLTAIALIIFIFQTNSILQFSGINNKLQNEEKGYCFPITILFVYFCLYFGYIYPVRISIATVIAFYSIKYIKSKSLLKFLALYILAISFHRTAIIFLPAYFIYHLKFNKKIILYTILGLFITVFFFGKATTFLGSILGGTYQVRAEVYSNSELGNEKSIFGLINMTMVFLVFLYLYFKKFKNEEQYNGMFNLYFVGYFLYVGAFIYSNTFFRASSFYTMTQIILMPYIFKIKSSKGINMILFVVFSVYFGLRMFSLLNNYWYLYVPYKSIFNTNLDVITY